MIYSAHTKVVVKEELVYWEKQTNKMCGLHCVNAILQGPFYDEVKLSAIAKELDEKEKKLMEELGTETKEFLLYMAQDSINHSAEGDYSIQVIEEALKRAGNLECKIVDCKQFLEIADTKEKLELNKENAFICNSGSHWFVLRKIQGVWYDLNSTNNYPEIMNEYRFIEFFSCVMQFQYSLFRVTGNLKGVVRPVFKETDLSPNQKWIHTMIIRELNGETPIMNNSMTDDTSAHQKPSAAKFVAAAAPVQGNHLPAHATPTHTAQANPPVHANHSIKTNVPAKPNLPVPAHALSAAEEAKFQAVPHTAAGPNPHKAIVVVEGIPQGNQIKIFFRLPDGSVVPRTFATNTLLNELYAFISRKTHREFDFTLMSNHPAYKTYTQCAIPLAETDLQDKQTLFVKKIKPQGS